MQSYENLYKEFIQGGQIGEMSFFMALTTALLWLRFLFMLELVPKVGTLIKISIKLLEDILTFAFLFLMTLLAFSSAGMISFVEL